MAKKRAKPKPTAPALRDRVKAFRRVRAGDLAPSPLNWRTHPKEQGDALRGLLAEVGFAGAVLARELPDGSLQLIDGHLRAETVGSDTEIPVLVLDVTADEAAKILATYDPLGAMAGSDGDRLRALLTDVKFESPAVEDLLRSLLPADAEDCSPHGGGDGFDGTPAAEGAGPTRAQPGDLWEVGRHRLLVGSCTEPANVSRLFRGDAPSLMVTDPPYGVEYDPTWRHKAGINKSKRVGSVANDDVADWTDAWRLFPGQVAYVWHGALHGPTVFLSLQAAGFDVRAQLVWVKPRLVLSRGHFHWQHEPAFVATSGETSDPEPSAEGELGYMGVRRGGSADWRGGRKQTTVWEIGFQGETKTHHGTQKPVECMARPIRNHGNKGEIVYDPFLGSGTTLIAAHRLGRVCYGCELEPRYADVILKRAEAEGLACEKVV